MALRVSLIIDGDASKAGAALKATVASVEQLDRAAASAGKATAATARTIDETGTAASTAGRKIQGLTENFNQLLMGTSNLKQFLQGAVTGLVGGLALGAVTQAFSMATGAAIAFASEAVTGAKAAEEADRRHKSAIDEIAAAYPQAAAAAEEYGRKSADALLLGGERSTDELAKTFVAQLQSVRSRLQLASLKDSPVDRLATSFFGRENIGTDDLQGFREQLVGFARDTRAAAEDRSFANFLLDITAGADATATRLGILKRQMDAVAQTTAGSPVPNDRSMQNRFVDAFGSPFNIPPSSPPSATSGGAAAGAFDIRPVKSYGDALAGVNGQFLSLGETANDLFSGIGSQLLRTGDLWGTLGDRALSAIGRIADGWINSGINSLLGSVFGGLGFGSVGLGGASGVLRGMPGPTYSGGGWVDGPGTGTSDSIVAAVSGGGFIRVSNKEFIVNAASAARHRSLLEAVNDNRVPGFAAGGSVGGGAAAAWGRPVVNVMLPPGATATTRDNDQGGVDVLVDLIDSRIDAFSRNRLPDRLVTLSRNPRRRGSG